MNILCVMHADFEKPGVIETWAKQSGHAFMVCKPYKGEECAPSSSFDFLVVMGGPQSPLKISEFPYLQEEISLIQRALQADKPILGICLGAQLIGEALGAKTSRSPEKEIGVFPIHLSPEGQQDPLLSEFSASFPVTHWHNDMPGETANSTVLAYSEGCPRQIIRYTPKVYGFQCHLEITREGIQEMIDACPNDFKSSRFTQNPADFLKQDLESINDRMVRILDRFADCAGMPK